MPDERMDRLMEAAKAEMADAGREIERAGRELQASVTELTSRRRAAVEFQEGQLVGLVEILERCHEDHFTGSALQGLALMKQALAVEQGPGGKFHRPGPRAA